MNTAMPNIPPMPGMTPMINPGDYAADQHEQIRRPRELYQRNRNRVQCERCYSRRMRAASSVAGAFR